MTQTAEKSTVPESPSVSARRPARRAGTSRRLERTLAICTPVGLLVVWEIAARTGVIDTRFFPAPTAIFYQMGVLAESGELWSNVWASMRRLFIGFWVGLVPALVLGVAMGLYMTQGIGYALAGAVGAGIGAVYAASGEWWPMLLIVLALIAVQTAAGVLVTRGAIGARVESTAR